MADILLVEDDRITAAAVESVLTSSGYRITHVDTAERAWEQLSTGLCTDAILLDRQLPGMDGVALLKKIKQIPRLSDIPVILQTSLDNEQSIREGIESGAYYYLTKPIKPDLLRAVVHTAIDHECKLKQLQQSLQDSRVLVSALTRGCFEINTLLQARDLSSGLAQLFPNPDRVLNGILELLVNAVEHGNLAISYADKTQLILENRWEQEIERRLKDPRLGKRKVTVEFERTIDNSQLIIRDEGEGFDWQEYLEFSTERIFDPHGRGIAMARTMSFDRLTYQGCGNTVVVCVNHTDE